MPLIAAHSQAGHRDSACLEPIRFARAGPADERYGVSDEPAFHPCVVVGRIDMPEGLRFQDARGDSLWAFAVGEFEEVGVVGAEIRRGGERRGIAW